MNRRRFVGMLAGLPLLPVALVAAASRPLLKCTIPIDEGYGPLSLHEINLNSIAKPMCPTLPPIRLKPDVIVGSKERIAQLRQLLM